MISGTPMSNFISSVSNKEYNVIQVVNGDDENLRVGLILLDKSNSISFGEIKSDLFAALNESTHTCKPRMLLNYFSEFIGSSQLFYSVMTSSPILIIGEKEGIIRKIILSILNILPEGLRGFKSFHTYTDNPQMVHFQGIPNYNVYPKSGNLTNATTIHLKNKLICGSTTCELTDNLARLLMQNAFADLKKEIDNIIALSRDVEKGDLMFRTLSSKNYEFLLKVNQALKDPTRIYVLNN